MTVLKGLMVLIFVANFLMAADALHDRQYVPALAYVALGFCWFCILLMIDRMGAGL